MTFCMNNNTFTQSKDFDMNKNNYHKSNHINISGISFGSHNCTTFNFTCTLVTVETCKMAPVHVACHLHLFNVLLVVLFLLYSSCNVSEIALEHLASASSIQKFCSPHSLLTSTHCLTNVYLLCLVATQCMWRRNPLSWRRTVGQYPCWLVSHTACRCRVMSAIWRRIFPLRSWSRTHPRSTRGTGHSEINPQALS